MLALSMYEQMSITVFHIGVCERLLLECAEIERRAVTNLVINIVETSVQR